MADQWSTFAGIGEGIGRGAESGVNAYTKMQELGLQKQQMADQEQARQDEEARQAQRDEWSKKQQDWVEAQHNRDLSQQKREDIQQTSHDSLQNQLTFLQGLKQQHWPDSNTADPAAITAAHNLHIKSWGVGQDGTTKIEKTSGQFDQLTPDQIDGMMNDTLHSMAALKDPELYIKNQQADAEHASSLKERQAQADETHRHNVAMEDAGEEKGIAALEKSGAGQGIKAYNETMKGLTADNAVQDSRRDLVNQFGISDTYQKTKADGTTMEAEIPQKLFADMQKNGTKRNPMNLDEASKSAGIDVTDKHEKDLATAVTTAQEELDGSYLESTKKKNQKALDNAKKAYQEYSDRVAANRRMTYIDPENGRWRKMTEDEIPQVKQFYGQQVGIGGGIGAGGVGGVQMSPAAAGGLKVNAGQGATPGSISPTGVDVVPRASPVGGVNAPATAPKSVAPTGMVRVVSPSGEEGYIPQANVNAALLKGYKVQ